eukprot:maker-scaffold789_size96855-snap-gene-0.25 protein:Tk12489 transcript:maker-scaffold789_size96855-snap-gene-0.25-mRNA-1 annotation:"n-acylglucosamine 2-epimerase"
MRLDGIMKCMTIIWEIFLFCLLQCARSKIPGILSVLGLTGLFGFTEVHAFPRNVNQYDYLQCPKVMQTHNLSRAFPGVVAHGLHSITLEDIQHYFNPETTEDNHVPTINLDLISDHAVLGYAPSLHIHNQFSSQYMRSVDAVLSHMDNANYDVKKYTTLERMVHVMHMNEMWEMAKPHYEELVAHPPENPKICPCVNGIQNNGILDMMKFMALKIREPELMYGQHLTRYPNSDRLKLEKDEDQGQEALDWDGNLYKFKFNKDQDGKEGHKEHDTPEEQLDWDGNLYKFDFAKDQDGKEGHKEHEKPEEQLDWDGNLYKFDFAKDQDGKEGHKEHDTPEEQLDWDDNLYKFDFAKDQDGKEGHKEHEKPEEQLDWDGNLYKFDFAKDKGRPGKKGMTPSHGNAKLDWHEIDYWFGQGGHNNR